MLAALADHGPERATWTEGGSGLGRRGAPSPEPDPSGRSAHPFPVDHGAGLVVAADARLDDRDALCDALGVPLPERAGLTDAELILRAFMRWGRDCPHHLLGDYAFAVRDRRRRTLFCARDHIGARPFYYALTTRRFVFASAVEAVLAAPDVSDALDERVVATHLTVEALRSGARTFFAAVRKLPPGHTLTVEAGRPEDGSGGPRVRIEQYWHPERAPAARPASDDAYAEQLLDLYTQAVRDRLRGGPVGVHLSGGLDSSSVAVLAAREARRRGHPPPLAFTWLPEPGARSLRRRKIVQPGPERRGRGDACVAPTVASFSTAQTPRPPKPEHAREYALVDAVCAQEGLQTCHGAPTPDDVLGVLRLDGTLPGVQVHLNEEIVQRHAAARGVRVLLSGWGGDEGVSFHGRGVLAAFAAERTLAAARRRIPCSGRLGAAFSGGHRAAAPASRSAVHAPSAACRQGDVSALAHRPGVRAAGEAPGHIVGAGGRGAAHAIAASASRASERAHRGVGGERRAAGHRVSLSAAGPAAAGVRSGAAARTVPARTLGPLAVSPRIAGGAPAGGLLEPGRERCGSLRGGDGCLRGGVSHDPALAGRLPARACPLRRHAAPVGTPGRRPLPGEATTQTHHERTEATRLLSGTATPPPGFRYRQGAAPTRRRRLYPQLRYDNYRRPL